jgi:excisionase family DNA binding protein
MSQDSEYLTIKQAAELLGVSPSTLRNWDRTGKVRAWRHPINGYRLYARPTLQSLRAKLTPPALEETNA